MYQKKFVSIYFSSDKIQVVKLNSKKTAVVKFASFDLPAGTVANHKVQDPKLLSETIKQIWSQLKIKEKAVGIIVPEFATYSKTLSLPLLSRQELDEAARWQAAEQLPFEKGKAILDWQIVKQDEKENILLLSAIASDVLTGYVDAVSSAGLYPLSVETPSISLIRIVSNEFKKRLIIYNGGKETLLLITEGQSITGSSVLSVNDEQTVLNTAMQFIFHYAQGKIEQIFVGGQPFSKNFYPELHQNLGGVQPQMLSLPIQGVNADQLQEYLVPLSQQMQDPQAPMDEKSINLLPPSWVKHYQDQLYTRQSWILTAIASAVVWVGVVSVVIALVVLNAQLNSVKNQISNNSQQSDEVVKKVEAANAVINQMAEIASYEFYPQNYINAITKAKPPAVTLESYVVNLEAGNATVLGFAPTRQDLITFKQQLEKNGDFAEVIIPISNLIAEENVTFNMELKKEIAEVKKPAPKLKL